MRKPYLIGGIAALLLALGIGWYFASPWWTLRQVAAAAQDNDPDKLSAFVDYEALRRDLKGDLTQRMREEVTRDDSPAAKLGMAVGMAMMNPMVDAFVSPAALKLALARMKVGKKASASDGVGKGGAASGGGTGASRQEGAKPEAEKAPRIERLGFSRFRVEDPQNPGSGLVFERRGLGWKLAGVDLPPGRPLAR
jgi:hypothetical protein